MFEELSSDENQWEGLAGQLGAYRWPSQRTWKDVIGGHIFFPREVFDWEQEDSEEYKASLKSTVWCYAIAAIYNHPIGKCYLIKALESWVMFRTRPIFFQTLYQESFEDLKKCEENSDACYVIGQNYQYPYLSSTFVKQNTGIEELAWYNKGSDLKSRCQVLNSQCVHQPPQGETEILVKKYLHLGKEGYFLAYIGACGLVESTERKETILQEALSQGHKKALYSLGVLKQLTGRHEKSTEYYEQAGKAGFSAAYLALATRFLGTIGVFDKAQKYTDLSEEEITSILNWCIEGGNANNLDAWEYLLEVCEKLIRHNMKSKKDLAKYIFSAIEGGMKLGSYEASRAASHYLNKGPPDSPRRKKYNSLIEKYGNQPGEDLVSELWNFVEKKRQSD